MAKRFVFWTIMTAILAVGSFVNALILIPFMLSAIVLVALAVLTLSRKEHTRTTVSV